MKKQIQQWTGIPISIGIAPSKALAKLANKIAKKFSLNTGGVYCIDTEKKRIKALKWTKIADVWGIGRQHKKRLEHLGVENAWQFTLLSEDCIQKHMTVVGVRIRRELLGLPTIQLEEIQPPKKSIATTRSFEGTISNFSDLEERISTFASSCAEKCESSRVVSTMLVFIKSDPHKKNTVPYQNSYVLNLPYITDSNIILSKYAVIGLKKFLKREFPIKKRV